MTDLPKTKYVSLSAALSWLAFGDARERKELNEELAGPAFGLAGDEALQRLENAVSLLTAAGFNGKVKFSGRHLKKRLANLNAVLAGTITEEIRCTALRDFAAFDITIDGLIFGNGLAWVPDREGSWTASVPKCTELYAHVVVQRSDLMREFKGGIAIASGQAKKELKRLSDAKLQAWYDSLDPDQQEHSRKKLEVLVSAAFPEHHVTRQRIRELTPNRKPGRKPNQP